MKGPFYERLFFYYERTYKGQKSLQVMTPDLMWRLLSGRICEADREVYFQMPSGLQVLGDAIREINFRTIPNQRKKLPVDWVWIVKNFQPEVVGLPIFKEIQAGRVNAFSLPAHEERLMEYLRWWYCLSMDLEKSALKELAWTVGVEPRLLRA